MRAPQARPCNGGIHASHQEFIVSATLELHISEANARVREYRDRCNFVRASRVAGGAEK
jgi:hypothetical protein